MCLACSKLLFPFSAVRQTGNRDACIQLIQVPGRHKQLKYNPCFALFVTYFHLQLCFVWALLSLIKMFILPLGLLLSGELLGSGKSLSFLRKKSLYLFHPLATRPFVGG